MRSLEKSSKGLPSAEHANDIGARAVPTHGGYYAEFRKVHKAGWRRVRVNGVDQIYPTEDRAEVMAWRALRDHIFTVITARTDAGSLKARSKAEELFGQVFNKGRSIPVERT